MVRWTFLIFGIVGFCYQAGGENGTAYDEHALVRLFPKNEEQLTALHKLQDPDVEVLKRSRNLNDSFDVLVPRARKSLVQDFAAFNGLDYEVKHENYGRTFEHVERTPRRRSGNGFKVYGYNSYGAMQDFLEATAQRHPDLVQLQSLSNSFEGRPINLVKISADPDAGNPIIFVDAGIHAREWASPAMALYLVHRLSNDPAARNDVLKGVDWHILPVVNPDGYEFTRSSRSNRLWRKTRSATSRFSCFGVDGNRNYAYKWGVVGVSNNPCDKETYAGPKPFSEPETRNVRDALMQNQKRIKLYVSLHSYGNYLVYPWGYTGDSLPPQWKQLDKLARSVSDAVQKAGGDPFTVMSAGKWYPAAGGSDDFAFAGVGIPYSYTMELTEGYEFTFPERNLHTVLPQFYEGFKAFAKQIRHEFGQNRHKRLVGFEESDKCELA